MDAEIISRWDLCLLLSLWKEKKIKVLNSLKLQCNETCKESVDKNTKERRKDIILNYARKFWIVLIYVYTGKTVVGWYNSWDVHFQSLVSILFF